MRALAIGLLIASATSCARVQSPSATTRAGVAPEMPTVALAVNLQAPEARTSATKSDPTPADRVAGAVASPGVEFSKEEITGINGSVSPADLAGSYRFGDGFWDWEMHLLRDGRFGVIAITDSLETAADGALRRGSFLDSSGTWDVQNGNVVRLKFRTKADDSSELIFTVVTVGGRLALQEPRFRPYLRRIYVKVQDPQTRYSEKGQPIPTEEAMPGQH